MLIANKLMIQLHKGFDSGLLFLFLLSFRYISL